MTNDEIVKLVNAVSEGKEWEYFHQGDELVTVGWKLPEQSIVHLCHLIGNGYKIRLKPTPKTGWINIYKDSNELFEIHDTKQDANKQCGPDRVACIEISYFDGQGLNEETK